MARTQQGGRWPRLRAREGAHGRKQFTPATLNGVPAAVSPQVNEFWAGGGRSAHLLQREEAFPWGVGTGPATQAWVEGRAGGSGQHGDLRGSVPAPAATSGRAGGSSSSVSVSCRPGAPAGRASCPVWATSAWLQGEWPEVQTELTLKTARSQLVTSCARAKADTRGRDGSPPPVSLPLLPFSRDTLGVLRLSLPAPSGPAGRRGSSVSTSARPLAVPVSLRLRPLRLRC